MNVLSIKIIFINYPKSAAPSLLLLAAFLALAPPTATGSFFQRRTNVWGDEDGAEGPSISHRRWMQRDAVDDDEAYKRHLLDDDEKAMFRAMLRKKKKSDLEMREELTESIKSNMDTKADPCDDFFRFACGGWLEQNPIPGDQGVWGILDVLQRTNDQKIIDTLSAMKPSKLPHDSAMRKASTAYFQCLDVDKTDELTPQLVVDVIKRIAGADERTDETKFWRRFYEQRSRERWNFTDALIRSHIEHGSKSFFDMFPFTDNLLSAKRILKFEESGLQFTNPLDFHDDNKVSALKNLIKGVMEELTPLKPRYARRFARNVISVESKIAQYFLTPEVKVDAAKTFHKVPFGRLFDGSEEGGSNDQKIDWFRILAAYKVFNFTLETPVDVENPDYFTNLNQLLPRLSPEAVRDYIIWTTVGVESRTLPTNVQRKYQEYRARVFGKVSDHPIKVRCLKVVAKIFPFAISRIFQHISFPESHKEYITAMVQFLKLTLLMRIPELEWMDETTKNRTSEKVLSMVTNLGYPEFVTNETELDEAAKDLKVSKSETIWQTYQKYLRNDAKDFDEMLLSNRSRFSWSYPDVSEANAGYKAASNNLEFPAGILQRPLFHPSFPEFWNFGSIAIVLGHEMSHGFDRSGSRFDKQGKQDNWWTKRSWREFEHHSECFVDFYSGYKIQGMPINGNLTVDENIADVGGVSLAYHAFQKWKKEFSKTKDSIGFPLKGISLTDNQLFFVAFGQTWCEHSRRKSMADAVHSWEHCPQPVRAEAAAALVPEFAREFKCKSGDAMNPSKRCGLWFSPNKAGEKRDKEGSGNG